MAEEFVSRRGKRTKVKGDDVVVTAPTSAQMPSAAHPPKPRKKRKLRWKLSRRAGMAVSIVLLVAAVVSLVTADSVKRDYERQTAAMRRAISNAGKNIPSQNAGSVAVADTLLKLLSASSACRVNTIDIASWYGPARASRDDCRRTAERYQQLRTAVSSARDIGAYSDAVDRALAPALAPPSDGQYAIAGTYMEAWSTAVSQVRDLKPPEVLKPAHASLVPRVEAIAAAWTAMQQAITIHDASGFTTAEQALQQKYSDLRQSAAELSAVAATLQQRIDHAVATLH